MMRRIINYTEFVHLYRATIRQNGFTLLEVIIGLAFIAMISLTLYYALAMGSRSSVAFDQKAQSLQDIRLATDFIRQQLVRVVPLAYRNREKQVMVRFTGLATEFKMVIHPPEYLSFGGLHEIRFYLQKDEEQSDEQQDSKSLKTALYSLALTSKKQEAIKQIVETEILKNIDSIKFEYFGAKNTKEQKEWQSEWEFAKNLPSLVRMQLQFLGESDPYYLVFPVPVTTPNRTTYIDTRRVLGK